MGPGQKPGRPVFSQRGSYILFAEDIKSKFDDQESDQGSEVGEQGHPEAGNYPIDTPPLSPIELKPDLPPYFPAIQGCRNVEEFSCLNRIEEGTYGVVYRAKDKKTGKFAGKTKELGIFKATSPIRLDPSAKSTKIQTKIKVCYRRITRSPMIIQYCIKISYYQD